MAKAKREIDKLLDDIQAILKRKKISIAQVARDLGYKGKSGYIQVYKWLVERRDDPSAEVTLMFRKWRDNNRS